MGLSSRQSKVLSPQEARIVQALGQTLFPRDRILGVDAVDAGVVEWVDDYVARLPPGQRQQIRALLHVFEVGFAVWALRPAARFTRARPAQRTAYVESWERSTNYWRRMIYEGLRAMFTFAYVQAPEVEESIGVRVPTDSELHAQLERLHEAAGRVVGTARIEEAG